MRCAGHDESPPPRLGSDGLCLVGSDARVWCWRSEPIHPQLDHGNPLWSENPWRVRGLVVCLAMPIREENRLRYPKDWKVISLEVREAAGWKCEGSPAFPDCRAENGKPHPATGSKVVLTVAHLDHVPENCGEPGNRPNLKAWCQRCHNTYDMPMRRRGIAERARQALGCLDLFDDLPIASA